MYTGHTKPWCILEEGGMADRTLDKARTTCIVHYKANYKAKMVSKLQLPTHQLLTTWKEDINSMLMCCLLYVAYNTIEFPKIIPDINKHGDC